MDGDVVVCSYPIGTLTQVEEECTMLRALEDRMKTCFRKRRSMEDWDCRTHTQHWKQAIFSQLTVPFVWEWYARNVTKGKNAERRSHYLAWIGACREVRTFFNEIYADLMNPADENLEDTQMRMFDFHQLLEGKANACCQYKNMVFRELQMPTARD